MVIYIEHELADAQVMRDILRKRFGLDTLTCSTVDECLQIAGERSHNLILMNIDPPGIDRITTLKVLKDIDTSRHIPVVAVIYSIIEGKIPPEQYAGFDDYIAKPINMKQLRTVIGQYTTASKED